jgi:hypothetical protein
MTGCGSQSSVSTGTNPSAVTAPVGLTVTDTPPAGVTVLFFQLSITGATLASQSGASVSLLSSTNPVPVNVSQLQTESAFLGSANVAAGTYNSLSLTFANPVLTIFNASDSGISSTCAVGSVCTFTPPTTSLSGPLTLSFSSTPFPITLTASSPLAFMLDIHLDTVIQSDLSLNLTATNGVALSQLPTPPTGDPISGLGRLIGTVQSGGTSANPNQFTLQSWDGRTFTINVNSSTTYNYPSTVCSQDSFSCVQSGQVVKVTVSLPSDGSLLATEVDYLQPATQQSVEGTVVGLSTSSGGNTIMDLILQVEPVSSMSSTLPLGQHVSVAVPSSGVTYAVDWGSFTPPSGITLSFGSASDLEVGQEVLVVVQGSVTTPSASGTSGTPSSTPVGPAALAFATSSITLEPSQITGTVGAVDANSLSFTLQTFPAFFVPPSATAGAPPTLVPIRILIATTTETTYEGLSPDNFSGVAANDLVSVEGWLFTLGVVPQWCTATAGCAPSTVMAAKAVLGRPGPTPLF